MSSRVDLAKQLLRDQEFAVAKQMLEKESEDPEALYLLSLLYRYDDEYDQEKTVIDKALKIDDSNTYMCDRLAWHSLPIFDRVVPRQPLHLSRDPDMTPSHEILEQMCFVTGADSKYFQLMVECIESIKATRLYKDVSIFVIDQGLTVDEKNYLVNSIKIKTIKNVKESFRDLDLQGLSASIFSRAYLPNLFPGYQYYFFVDADTWVHDERAIDRYLKYACDFGLGGANESGATSARENVKCWDYPHCFQNILSNKYLDIERLRTLPLVNGGLWCMRQDLFERYQFYMQECIDAFGLKYFTDMAALHAMMLERKISDVLSIYDNYQIPKHRHTLPFCDENNVFYAQQNRQPVGLVHLTPNAANISYTDTYALDVQTGQPRQVSYHYRTWPWQDKQEIQEMIRKEENE